MTQESHYPEEIIIGKDTSTSMFIAAIFTIARTCKQPRCPSKDEKIHCQILLSYKNTNVFESVLMRWINLELII